MGFGFYIIEDVLQQKLYKYQGNPLHATRTNAACGLTHLPTFSANAHSYKCWLTKSTIVYRSYFKRKTTTNLKFNKRGLLFTINSVVLVCNSIFEFIFNPMDKIKLLRLSLRITITNQNRIAILRSEISFLTPRLLKLVN